MNKYKKFIPLAILPIAIAPVAVAISCGGGDPYEARNRGDQSAYLASHKPLTAEVPKELFPGIEENKTEYDSIVNKIKNSQFVQDQNYRVGRDQLWENDYFKVILTEDYLQNQSKVLFNVFDAISEALSMMPIVNLAVKPTIELVYNNFNNGFVSNAAGYVDFDYKLDFSKKMWLRTDNNIVRFIEVVKHEFGHVMDNNLVNSNFNVLTDFNAFLNLINQEQTSTLANFRQTTWSKVEQSRIDVQIDEIITGISLSLFYKKIPNETPVFSITQKNPEQSDLYYAINPINLWNPDQPLQTYNLAKAFLKDNYGINNKHGILVRTEGGNVKQIAFDSVGLSNTKQLDKLVINGHEIKLKHDRVAIGFNRSGAEYDYKYVADASYVNETLQTATGSLTDIKLFDINGQEVTQDINIVSSLLSN